jgi:hypothetical protein
MVNKNNCQLDVDFVVENLDREVEVVKTRKPEGQTDGFVSAQPPPDRTAPNDDNNQTEK